MLRPPHLKTSGLPERLNLAAGHDGGGSPIVRAEQRTFRESPITGQNHGVATNFGPGINVPQGRPATLPDGAGKDLVAAQCSVCHGLDRVTAAKRSPAAWKDVLARMKFLGASYSPEEEGTIASYLDMKFSLKTDAASR